MGTTLSRSNLNAKRSIPCENSRAVHISPHKSGTVIDSENSSINVNIKSTWAFQRAINRGCALPLTSSKWGLDIKICRLLQKFRRKANKSLMSKNFQQQSCQNEGTQSSSSKVVVRSTTYRTVSIFWQGKTPFP